MKTDLFQSCGTMAISRPKQVWKLRLNTSHVRALLADERDIAGTVILIQGIIQGPRGQSNGTYSQNSAQPERSRQGAEAAPSQEQRRSEPKAGPICDEPPPQAEARR